MAQSVLWSGSALASALAIIATLDDIEGLIIGRVSRTITSVLGDHGAASTTKEEITIAIEHLEALGSGGGFSFYNSSIQINAEKIRGVQKSLSSPLMIVGWFRNRIDSPLTLSLRETAVHQELATFLSSSPPLLFALFTPKFSIQPVLQTYDHQIFRERSNNPGVFDAVPISISNLSQGTNYRLFVPAAPIDQTLDVAATAKAVKLTEIMLTETVTQVKMVCIAVGQSSAKHHAFSKRRKV